MIRIIFFAWIISIAQITIAQGTAKLESDWHKRTGDVFCLGQAIYDIVFKFNDQKQLEQHLKPFNLKIGQNKLIDYQTAKRIINELQPYHKGAGGGASNTIAGIAALHGTAFFTEIVADDKLGHLYRTDMEKYGVTTNIIFKTKEYTGIVIVLLAPDGERTMLAYPGISKSIVENDIDHNVLNKYKVFLTEGYLWDFPGNAKIITNIFKLASTYGIHTAFAFGDEYVVKKYRQEFLSLIPNIDIILSSEDQALALFSTNDLQTAIKEMQKLARIAVITLGVDGAVIVTKHEVIRITAQKIDNIVDKTGAGDQFAARFLYGYTNNLSLRESGELGIKVASYKLQHFGAKP